MIFFTILIKLILLLKLKNFEIFFKNNYNFELNGNIVIPPNYQLSDY